MKRLIHNAIIVNHDRRFRGHVLTCGVKIVRVGEGDAPHSLFDADEVVDAECAYLLPGAIDTHVHFREPGMTNKADIASESLAAVAGGVTSYVDMPNTIPPTITPAALKQKSDIASATSAANYGFFVGATVDNLDYILSADQTTFAGVKLFLGSSTGSLLMDDSEALERLFSSYKGLIAVHAEDEGEIRAAREEIVKKNGKEPDVTLHSQLRGKNACIKATRRVIDLALRYNARLHILHISTADEIELLRNLPKGHRITAETCPHYLAFIDADIVDADGYALRKCNPAIKTAYDRAELLRAISDRTISTIATDHAPHRLEEKIGNLFTAASGMPSVKFMLPIMADMAYSGLITLERVVELTSAAPARLFGIRDRGMIAAGAYADMTLIRYEEQPCTIAREGLNSHLPDASDSQYCWSPYEGRKLHSRIIATWVNGSLVYDGDKAIHSHVAMPLTFER